MEGELEYFGLYWTYKVTWAGFKLPKGDFEEVAAASKTIRYQRELVRRYVAKKNGRLTKELIFEESNRPSNKFEKVLRPAKQKCTDGRAKLVLVQFDKELRWRKHKPLMTYLKNEGFCFEALDPIEVENGKPVEIYIDRKPFNYIEHFRNWGEATERAHEELPLLAQEALEAAAEAISGSSKRYELIASRLNDSAVKTSNGRKWTYDSVRKQMDRWGID